MIALLGVVLSILISVCWMVPIIRAQGDIRALKAGDYAMTVLVFGLLCACLPIIITEIAWDAIFGVATDSDLPKQLLESFFRAALLEEAFKLLGFVLAKRNRKPRRKIDYMVLAGLIGLTYSIVEKAVTGNLAGIVIGLLLPMHILWQLNQGGHFFEYEKAKAEGNTVLAHKELLMALLIPFVFHGCWDSLISITTYCIMHGGSTGFEVLGVVMFVAIMVIGIVYIVKTMKKALAIARADRNIQPSTAE